MFGTSAQEAADGLGNGSLVMAQKTVPFTIWVAAQHLDDYPAAIITCIAADGDIDTTSAVVGGIVAAYTGAGARPGPIVGVPQTWLAAREPLPGWFDRSVERDSARILDSAASEDGYPARLARNHPDDLAAHRQLRRYAGHPAMRAVRPAERTFAATVLARRVRVGGVVWWPLTRESNGG